MSSSRDKKAPRTTIPQASKGNPLDFFTSAQLDALHNQGLENPEIAVYLSLLKAGSKPASLAAKGAGLKRGQTYNILEALCAKGLVQEFVKEGVRHFSAGPPQILLQITNDKLQQLDHDKNEIALLVESLESIKGASLPRTKVHYYRGDAGLKSLYESTLDGNHREIYAIADFATTFPHDKSPELNRWMWNYSRRRARKGIKYYGILNKSGASDEAYRRRKEDGRILKMIQEIEIPVEINLFGDKVAITSTAYDMSGVLIEDPLISRTLIVIHQMLWRFLPAYKA